MKHTSRSVLLLCLSLGAGLVLAADAGAAGLVGGLYVITEPPEAAIYVSGELRGISPCGIGDVPIGQVEVRAEKQGWAAVTETVSVEGDQTVQVTLSMARLRNVGSVAVLVDPPGARVWLDRVPAGRTPTVILNVRAGTHRIEVEAEGFRRMQSAVTVAPNEQFVVRGKLESVTGGPADVAAAGDLDRMGELSMDSVPATAQLPEAADLEPVRKLLNDRKYDEALRKLEQMASDEKTRRHMQRIALVRRLARQMELAVTHGYRELRKAAGQDYVLTLRKGIQFAGTIVDVTDTEVVVEATGKEHRLPLRSISAAQIVRLASTQLPAEDPKNAIRFALLHAAEGEFDEAYEHLRVAAQKGGDISEARSYVEAEHLWAAAVQKEQTARLAARASGGAVPPKLDTSSGPVQVLLDTYRGAGLSEQLRESLTRQGFAITPLSRRFTAQDAEQADLLVIRDPGPGRAVPAYDRQELQRTMDWLRRGGGLVFFGAYRPVGQGRQQRPRPNPFASLLRWYGIQVRADVLSVSDEAPDGYPSEYALCFPTGPHPVTYEVRGAALPLTSAPLWAENPSWVLMRTSPFVVSRESGEVAPAVVAARALGEGRVVVFANLPVVATSPARRSPLYGNDGEKLLINSLLWAAGTD